MVNHHTHTHTHTHVSSLHSANPCPQNCSDGEEKPTILILGNKIDLEDERKVSTATAQQAADEFGTLFAEVSAKTGQGVNEVRVAR